MLDGKSGSLSLSYQSRRAQAKQTAARYVICRVILIWSMHDAVWWSFRAVTRRTLPFKLAKVLPKAFSDIWLRFGEQVQSKLYVITILTPFEAPS